MGWIALLAVMFMGVGSYAFFSCLFRDILYRPPPARRYSEAERAWLASEVRALSRRLDDQLGLTPAPVEPAADPRAPSPYRHHRRIDL